MDVANVALRIGVSPWNPGVNPCYVRRSERSPNSLCMPGIELEILLAILHFTGFRNFSFRVTQFPGCGYVEYGQNNTVRGEGIALMLAKGDVDLSGNICSLKDERTTFFEYTWPIYMTKQVFVIKNFAGKSAYVFHAFRPFSRACLIACALTILISYVAAVLEAIAFPKLNKEKHRTRGVRLSGRRRQVRLLVGLIWNMLNVKKDEQSSSQSLVISSLCMRVIWVAFIGMFLTFYSSNILSIFMKPSVLRAPFGSSTELAPLIETGSFKFITYQTPFRPPRTTNVHTEAQFAAGVRRFGTLNVPNRQNTRDIYDAVATHRNLVYATVDSWAEENLVQYENRSSVQVISDQAAPSSKWYCYLLANSGNALKFKTELNYGVIIAQELVQTIRKRYLHKASLREIVADEEYRPVFLDQMASLFTNYLRILTVYMVVLGVELCVHAFSRKCRRT